jgi:hypothetical protein
MSQHNVNVGQAVSIALRLVFLPVKLWFLYHFISVWWF